MNTQLSFSGLHLFSKDLTHPELWIPLKAKLRDPMVQGNIQMSESPQGPDATEGLMPSTESKNHSPRARRKHTKEGPVTQVSDTEAALLRASGTSSKNLRKKPGIWALGKHKKQSAAGAELQMQSKLPGRQNRKGVWFQVPLLEGLSYTNVTV